MQYKLLALDMDGTLLTRSKKIHKDDLQAIKVYTELGGKVIISTGRHIGSLKKYAQQIYEYTGKKIPYFITLNGAEIYDENFECIYSRFIDKATVNVINKILKEHKIYYLCYPAKKDKNDDPTPLVNLRILKPLSAKYRIKPDFYKGYFEGDLYK